VKLLAAFLVAAALAFQQDVSFKTLPEEAKQTVALIRNNGPFPYQRDGAVFGNREGYLPKRERGYYREYTVKTPGARDRGARRIVAGRDGELYYSDDHYRSFRKVVP
jgi:ribonuclease T1